MINSRIKVQYWMHDRMIAPSDNLLLYPNGSDIVSEVHFFDADWTDAHLDSLDSAWNFGNGILRAAERNLLSAGFSAPDFGCSINNVLNDLSNKVGTKAATLAIAYPNALFNTIHIVFEADAEGYLKSPAASPPTNPSAFQYSSSRDVGRHQRAEYIINLDQLRAHMGDDRFYGSASSLEPGGSIAFAFADVEADERMALSVLQTLSVSFHYGGQLPIIAATDIYYLRGRDLLEPGNLVEVQRLIQYTPTIEEMIPGSDDAWQGVNVPVERFYDGSYRIHGQPYECIMLWFEVVSLRAYNPNQPRIEIIGEVKPENQEILRPQVWQPIPFLNMDRLGQSYQAEGKGIAITPAFRPSDLHPGTNKVYFIANQDSSWDSVQVVSLMPALVPSRLPPAPPSGRRC